jgi:PKD repeat protein
MIMIVRKLAIALPVTLVFLVLMAPQLRAAQVQLSWSAPTTNADGTPLRDLAGYKVYFGLASRTYGTPIDVGNKTTYTLSGLTGGLRYYFAVKAYDTSGNNSAFSTEVSFVPPLDTSLVANFTATPTSGTAPLAVAFTDTSTGTITSWSWKFGDGGTSTQRNVTYTYKTPGTYDVTLTVLGGTLSNTVTKKAYITVSQPPVSSSGLVASYSFNEGTGTTVNDTSGMGNHGTISGATWTSSGRFGKALLFDGRNNWVTIPDSASLDLTSSMTLEAWVYPTTTLTGWETVIAKETPGNVVDYLFASSDRHTPVVGGLFGSSSRDLYGGARLATNVWTHLAGTYNGTTQRLYVNGVQVASQSQTGQMQVSSGALRIGGNSIGSKEFFKGRIDEVRIYNRALAASEIQADMNKAIGATPSVALMVQSARAPSKLGEILSALGKSTPSVGSGSQQTTNGSATSRASTTITATSGLLTSEHVEIGELVVDHQWKRVDLSKPFMDPVVVAKALSYRDATPAVVRIRQTDTTGFELRLQPWDDSGQPRPPETVGYLVIECGRFRLPDGTSVESGTFEPDPVYPMHSIAFSQSFLTVPVVMTAVTSALDSNVVIGRPTQVSKEGYHLHLQQALAHPLDAMQTVSYVAWEPSTGTLDALVFEVNRMQDVSGGQFSTISFKEIFADAPVFLADIQASRGGTPINVRWGHKDLGGIDVKIEDEPDLNVEGAGPQDSDVVGYILIR